MEFLYKNQYPQTTTAITTTGNGTATLEYLFDRNYSIGWTSENFNNDLTSCTLTFSFDTTQTVSRIALMGHNLKQYRMFYNGVTANTFTPDINYSDNSDTSQFFSVTEVPVTSVTLQMDSTIIADQEKELSECILTYLGVSFERTPSARSFKPIIDRKAINHKMSDGGNVQHIIADRFGCRIKYKFIGETFYNDLKTFYELSDPFLFVAFPTSTGWDEILHEVNWIGDLKLREYSSENPDSGFNVDIRLQETAK